MATYWTFAFLALLLLHFVVLPRLLARIAVSSLESANGSSTLVSRPFLVWSGGIALFTLVSYMRSVVIWDRAGYLGTLFFLCAPLAWFYRWLGGGMRDPEESEGFDQQVSATLTGCVLGTGVGWLLSRVLGGVA